MIADLRYSYISYTGDREVTCLLVLESQGIMGSFLYSHSILADCQAGPDLDIQVPLLDWSGESKARSREGTDSGGPQKAD